MVIVFLFIVAIFVSMYKKNIPNSTTPGVVIIPIIGSYGFQCGKNGVCTEEGTICDSLTNICRKATGQPCTQYSQCVSNSICNGLCQTTTDGELNKPCPCNDGFTCRNINGISICKVNDEEMCTVDNDCNSRNCVSGVCKPTTGEVLSPCWNGDGCISGSCQSGVCNNGIAFGEEGAYCDENVGCNPGSSCTISGTCQKNNNQLFAQCYNVGCDGTMICTNIIESDLTVIGQPCSSDNVSLCGCTYEYTTTTQTACPPSFTLQNGVCHANKSNICSTTFNCINGSTCDSSVAIYSPVFSTATSPVRGANLFVGGKKLLNWELIVNFGFPGSVSKLTYDYDPVNYCSNTDTFYALVVDNLLDGGLYRVVGKTATKVLSLFLIYSGTYELRLLDVSISGGVLVGLFDVTPQIGSTYRGLFSISATGLVTPYNNNPFGPLQTPGAQYSGGLAITNITTVSMMRSNDTGALYTSVMLSGSSSTSYINTVALSGYREYTTLSNTKNGALLFDYAEPSGVVVPGNCPGDATNISCPTSSNIISMDALEKQYTMRGNGSVIGTIPIEEVEQVNDISVFTPPLGYFSSTYKCEGPTPAYSNSGLTSMASIMNARIDGVNRLLLYNGLKSTPIPGYIDENTSVLATQNRYYVSTSGVCV